MNPKFEKPQETWTDLAIKVANFTECTRILTKVANERSQGRIALMHINGHEWFVINQTYRSKVFEDKLDMNDFIEVSFGSALYHFMNELLDTVCADKDKEIQALRDRIVQLEASADG